MLDRQRRRLLLRHHPLRVHRPAAGRVRRALRGAARRPRRPAWPAATVGRPGGRGRRRRPDDHRRRRLRRRTSSTAPATASASRSTRIPTSWPATTRRWSPATPSRSSRASTSGSLGGPHRGHRGRHATPAPIAERRRPRPRRGRGLTARARPSDRRHDRLRRRLAAAAVGDRRPVLPVGHHPPARGRARLRLADARHLPGHGGRRGLRRHRGDRAAAGPRRSRRSAWRWPTAVALAVSVVRRRAGVSGQVALAEQRSARGWRP